MIPPRQLTAGALAALFAIGAIGGLIGDMCHVESGTTRYLEDPLPYVWRSQLWFPVVVGAGTAALGWLRLRLAPAGPPATGRVRDGAAMIAAVVGLYALTALVRGEPQAPSVVLVYALAALICASFARSPADLVCGGLAAIFGVGGEIVLSAAGTFEYAEDVSRLAGVASWLPALYVAFGVVAARLGELMARSRSG